MIDDQGTKPEPEHRPISWEARQLVDDYRDLKRMGPAIEAREEQEQHEPKRKEPDKDGKT